MLLDVVAESLRMDCRLDPDQPLLVGVSGGPDSLCLLDALHRLGYKVIAAHYDHKLRAGSQFEGEFVRQVAASLTIPFLSGSGNVRAWAESQGFSVEEAARKMRYTFLFEQARKASVQAVAVGHTADDQCETILMHFLRGSGIAGLRGMRPRSVLPEWDAELPLVRPLLGVWRSETRAYCANRDLHPVHDPTNEAQDFFRNRLRLEVIPYLEQFNPQLKPGLLRMAEVLAGDEEILAERLDDQWSKTVSWEGEDFSGLQIPVLLGLNAGLQRRIVRRVIQRLVPDLRDIDFDSVERLLAVVRAGGPRSPFELIDGVMVRREAKTLYISHAGAALPETGWFQLTGTQPQILAVPGCIPLEAGMQLCAKEIQVQDPLEQAAGLPVNEAWLDAASLEFPLQVRAVRPGDRFQPLGMESGSIKMSDFFINEKVPHRARQLWPLVFSGGILVWAAGLRMGHLARIHERSERVVQLQVCPQDLGSH